MGRRGVAVRVSVCLLVCLSWAGRVKGRCDDGWLLWPEGGTCYHVSSAETQLDAESAHYYCKNVFDSFLVSIDNFAEWKYINNNITKCLATDGDCTTEKDTYWVGIYRGEMSSSNFVWDRMDGYVWVDDSVYDREVDFYLWDRLANEPAANTQCGALKVNGYLAGKHCIFKHRYICEKDALPTTTVPTTTAAPTTTTEEQTTSLAATTVPPLEAPAPTPSTLPIVGNAASRSIGAFSSLILSTLLIWHTLT